MAKRKQRNISSDRIRAAREGRGYSQVDVPGLLRQRGWDLSTRAYAFVETGDRQILDWQLRLLADILGVSTDWLVGKD